MPKLQLADGDVGKGVGGHAVERVGGAGAHQVSQLLINDVDAGYPLQRLASGLADAAELWPGLPSGPLYSALVPNLKGLERALACGVKRIALFTAASESFTQRNINMSIDQIVSVYLMVRIIYIY